MMLEEIGPAPLAIGMWPIVAIVLAVALVAVIVGDLFMRRRAGSVVEAGRDQLERDRGRMERQMDQRRADLEAAVDDRRRSIEVAHADRLAQLDEQSAQLAADRERIDDELARIGGLTPEQARREVVDRAREEATVEAETLTRAILAQARATAEDRAREVVATAIARCAGEVTADSVVAAVDLPSDDMKGRIIGREGRNIRSIEQVTGATVIIDDTPGIVLVSCFDPIRREVARTTIELLVADGRIHPGRIEQAHATAVKRIEQMCLDAADEALHALSITSFPQALRPILGSLRFRTSFGQDVLSHSVECGRLAGLLAAEIGADVVTCTRAAFLHDLGKALTPGIEGSHASVGAELARRYGEDDAVVHAIAAHHDEVPAESVVDVITQAADAISASRPGARRESLEAHVNRLEELENLASAHPGVSRAVAVQAGRELRVMVVPEQVDDAAARDLARVLAAEVGDRIVVPGQVRVTVIRETRAVEVVGASGPRD